MLRKAASGERFFERAELLNIAVVPILYGGELAGGSVRHEAVGGGRLRVVPAQWLRGGDSRASPCTEALPGESSPATIRPGGQMFYPQRTSSTEQCTWWTMDSEWLPSNMCPTLPFPLLPTTSRPTSSSSPNLMNSSVVRHCRRWDRVTVPPASPIRLRSASVLAGVEFVTLRSPPALAARSLPHPGAFAPRASALGVPADYEHGPVRTSQRLLGDAADERVLQPAHALGAQDDGIGPNLLGYG
jgi:hypothetical protein